jgi:hypothetical protein
MGSMHLGPGPVMIKPMQMDWLLASPFSHPCTSALSMPTVKKICIQLGCLSTPLSAKFNLTQVEKILRH